MNDSLQGKGEGEGERDTHRESEEEGQMRAAFTILMSLQ